MSNYRPEGTLIDTLDNKNSMKTIFALKEAKESSKLLEARAVVCDSQHNLIVDLGCIRGIIPRNECAIGISDGTTRDIAIISKVNKPVCFKITSFEKDENGAVTAILSRRIVQEECQREYVDKLECGQIIPVKVTHLEQFGCFVDIGCGICSLIPIDAISVSRISHPRDRFYVGQDIFAVVSSKDENSRITLSHKELLGTWAQNASLFSPGQTVAGIVRSVEDYGIFVELAPNLAGLAEPHPDVKAGQHASVYIKNIIPEKMKVKLIIVDAFDAEYEPKPLKYTQTSGKIDVFRYSPKESQKVIESVFKGF